MIPARIRWLFLNAERRNRPLPSDFTPASFISPSTSADDPGGVRHGPWSLRVALLDSPGADGWMRAEVGFAFAGAPHGLLGPGAKLEVLAEPRKLHAEVEVLAAPLPG